MTFFYDKLTYLEKRYWELIDEAKNRGFVLNPSERNVDFTGFEKYLYNDFKPNKRDMLIVVERIRLRIDEKPHLYKYYSKNLDKSYFLKLKRLG